MLKRSLLGTAVTAALVAATLLVPSAAHAAQASFTNPLATPATDDLDVSSIDVRYTDSALTVTSHYENFTGNDYGVILYVLTGKVVSGSPIPDLIGIIAESTGGAPAETDGVKYTGGTSAPISTTGVTLARDTTAKTLVMTVPSSILTLTGPVYIAEIASDSVDSAMVGKQFSSDLEGLGPIARGPVESATTVTLTAPAQTYGTVAASVVATVTPADAAGIVQVFDGVTLIASAPVSAGKAVVALPATLSSGTHLLVAKFVPADGVTFGPSSSAAFPLSVISSAAATKATIKLSKSTQKYKKTASKVTVSVSGKPAGTVAIYDGKKKLKTVTLKKGKATYTLSKKLKKGTHKIKAVFTPTDVEAFAPSTSKVVKLKVKK